MPLRVRNSDLSLQFDSSVPLTQQIGQFDTGGQSTGTFTDDAIAKGRPWYVWFPIASDFTGAVVGAQVDMQLYLRGTTFTWSFTHPGFVVPVRVIYGIY